MSKIFLVEHLKTGQIKYAYDENEDGFLHINPFYPVMGINSSRTFTLKKPFWVRIKK